MKIGVMTLPLNNNYGGNLQAYAMMEALKQLGHSPIFINRRHPPKVEVGDKVVVDDAYKAVPLLSNKHHGFSKKGEINKLFSEKFISPVTGFYNDPVVLKDFVDHYEFDAVIVGSDQVWRPKYAKTVLPDLFLSFLPEESKTKRISYAASFGAPKWEFDDKLTKMAASQIKLFDAVSVREDSAVQLCQEHLGVTPEHVLDPTLLLSAEHYAEKFSLRSRQSDQNKLLAYVLDIDSDKAQVIESFSKRLSLETFSTNGLPFAYSSSLKSSDGDRTVEGWLASFHEASFIITDSFHGVVFSILFNKPFIAYGNPKRGIARFTSLLKMFGLESRLVLNSGDIDVDSLVSPIDWHAVNEKLEVHRSRSFDFLTSALAEVSQPISNNMASSEAASISRGVKINNIPLRFETNDNTWNIAVNDESAVLKVAPGAAVLGNMVWCDFPESLRAGAKYKLVLHWSVSSEEAIVKPCIRNPSANKNHVIGKVEVNEVTTDFHSLSIEFSPPSDGFTQFVLGGASFTGANGGVEIKSITLHEVAGNTSLPTATLLEKAQELASWDLERFSKAILEGKAIDRARARLMFYAHAVEKGLSHMNFRPGFGQKPVRKLAVETENWLKKNYDLEDYFFKAAISTMHVYFERHKAINFDVTNFWNFFTPRLQSIIAQADDLYGGVLPASSSREAIPEENNNRSFMDVIYSRRSVREFTDVPIRDSDIQDAVRIGMQAPSVCNRQGVRVHYYKDPAQIANLVDLQGGFNGYKKPPGLLLVTCDLTAFLQAKERNQAYVDGGLFAMSLLLGLEQAGLGACPLNAMMTVHREKKMRKVAKISETEVFVSFIAVGYFNPEVLVPRSVRYPVQHLLHIHKAEASE